MLLKIMIAKDNSSISSPVGKTKYAYVGQRSRSKQAKKVILNHTHKPWLVWYQIEENNKCNRYLVLKMCFHALGYCKRVKKKIQAL